MKTKLPVEWLSSPQYRKLSHQERFALLTSMIRASACGWIIRDPDQLFVDTGSKIEVLESAIKKLGSNVVHHADGWWLPFFIEQQVGIGDALAADNMSCSVCRAIRVLESDYPEVVKTILTVYPTLKPRYSELCRTGKMKTSRTKAESPNKNPPPPPPKAGEAPKPVPLEQQPDVDWDAEPQDDQF